MDNSTSEINWNIIIPIVSGCITILGSVITWALSERNKRKHESYIRREQKYAKLIESLKGFYEKPSNVEMKNQFLLELNLSWMYCPDSVIKKAYKFLGMVHIQSDKVFTDNEKEKAVGEFMLEIRKDMISNTSLKKTTLTAEEFKHLKAT